MNERSSYRYLVYALFLASGMSGLIYQIVWTRMLVLVFGNTMLAMSTVLSSFMGGLAAGSYVLGRYIDQKPRPLIRVYSVLEAGIGLFALIFPLLLAVATPVYSTLYGAAEGNIVLLNLARFVVCFALIFVPTFLMGGTLPVLIKRFAGAGGNLGHQTGFLYGLNTVGAVLGTIACGYFLLRLFGMQRSTWVAVAINLGVALIAWYLGSRKEEALALAPAEEAPVAVAPAPAPEYSLLTRRLVMVGIGLSGFCALAYEVFWTRMLNLFLHNNIYSFTAILATFLVGIAVGSLFYARFLSRSKRQVELFIWLEIAIGTISFATPYIFRLLHGSLFNNFNEALTLAKTSVVMIGPTIMMGIAVPLAIQICQRGTDREGTSVGSVYAINTIGAILGAFAAGFILLPSVGLHTGVIFVSSLNILAGFLPIFGRVTPQRRVLAGGAFAVIVALMFLTAPGDLFRGLFQAAHPNADIVHYKEGKVANVLVYDFKKLGYKDFHLNAVNEASSRLWHVQLFKLLGILPTLVHDDPDDALMIAFGAGMSAGATATNVSSLDVVDLNPDIAGIAEAYTRENLDVINQPNFNQVVNDGRNALLLNDRKYSLIISDATNPKMFDSWTLYSQEFYELAKSRLKPGGVFCQWAVFPLPYDSIKVILNTFRSVFPHMSFWVIHGSSQVLMLGTPDRLEIDYAEFESRLEPLLEKGGLEEFGIGDVAKFLSFLMLGEDGLGRMLAGFDRVSTDDMPHAQFHIDQDAFGIDQCLDLVRYQESILPYMTNLASAPPDFETRINAYEDIGRRLNIAWLLNHDLRFAEAAVVSADANLDDANVAHHLHHCPEKKRHFAKRLVTHPDDANAHNWLGSIQMKDGELEQAEAQLRKALELQPDYADARVNLALTLMAAGRYDEAEEELLVARAQNPTRRMISAVPRKLAILRILRMLEFEPDSAELNRALGIACYNDGQIVEAIEAYRRAVELSDGDPATMYNLARIYERHEFIDELIELYGRLEAARPGDMAIAAKRREFAALSDPQTRRDWLNDRLPVPSDSIEEDGKHPASCDQALKIWAERDTEGSISREKLVGAADLYERSVNARPDDLHAYTDAATIREALGDYEAAADLWTRLAQQKPDLEAARAQAARLEARARLENERRSGAVQTTTLRNTAAAYRRSGDPETALGFLVEAVEIAPNDAMAWTEYAETAEETGRYDLAFESAERALELQPDLARASLIRDRLADVVRQGR